MPERLVVRAAVRMFSEDAGVSGLDLSVAAGEIHAIVGLNGSGKTTLMRAILGMLRLTSGSISINDTPLAQLPSLAWRRVGHLVEGTASYAELDVRCNLEIAARLQLISSREIRKVVQAAIDELDLGQFVAVRARHLSLGNQQRVGLAAALQHQPTLIVLDEPTNALDPAGVILLRELVQQRAEKGAGVLISSHHLDEVARIAHRISILNHGRIIGSLDPAGDDVERAFFNAVRVDDEERAT